MELWNLIVSFFANVPLYYQTNRTLFLLTLGVVLVYGLVILYSNYKVIASSDNPLFKAGYMLVAAIGTLSLVASGIAFVSAQEVAEIRPEVLTRPLFVQLAVVGALYAVLWAVIIYRRADDLGGDDAMDAVKSFGKGVFVAIFSAIGAFVGEGISSWGFALFGRTLGTWLFGAYLAWAMKAVFGVVGFVVQGPLVLLFGNPDEKVESILDQSLDGIFDAFEKPKGERDWRKVIIPAAIVIVAVVGLGIARNASQEVATVPEAPAAAEPDAPEAPAEAELSSPANLKHMPEDHVMDWGDPVLEEYMREATGISEGDIWLHDVRGLTSLDLSVMPDENNVIQSGPRITNIDALAELTNLRELELRYHSVEDISAVASMPHLVSLGVMFNPVSDLSPVSGLGELQWLDVSYCRVSDLSPLSGCASLRMLILRNNRITSVEPLSGLTGLEYLVLEGNPIEDYSPVEGLGIEELLV